LNMHNTSRRNPREIRFARRDRSSLCRPSHLGHVRCGLFEPLSRFSAAKRQTSTSRTAAFSSATNRPVALAYLCGTQKEQVPPLALQRNYDPKRGRYKRYADQLASGDKLIFHDNPKQLKPPRMATLHAQSPTAQFAWVCPLPQKREANLRRRSLGPLNSTAPSSTIWS